MNYLAVIEKYPEEFARAVLAVEIRVPLPDRCLIYRFDPETFKRL